jgi:single-strand DNA-binding protein
MNQVKLIGNVGNNVNIREFEKSKLASFSIATNETFENKNSESVTNTQWHNIVAWGNLAEKCEELIEKGKLVSIEGKLQTRNYINKENKKVYITEILAFNVSPVEAKKSEKVFFL